MCRGQLLDNSPARPNTKVWARRFYRRYLYYETVALSTRIIGMFSLQLFTRDPSYADGLVKAYVEENKMIDTLDPTTGRREYAMWTFCNNHDNWRLQSMTSSQTLRMCLAVITFWPGTEGRGFQYQGGSFRLIAG